MASFTDLKSLLRHIEKDIKNGMREVGKEAKQITKKHVDDDVYDKYSPSVYDRTGQLKDSIESFEITGTEGEHGVIIQHDTSKITSSKDPTYNHYSRKPNGHDPDVSDEYMEWVHDGRSGGAFGFGEWQKPRPYMDNARNEIKNTNVHVKTLKSSLTQKGYDVE